MTERRANSPSNSEDPYGDGIFDLLPQAAKRWAESLPWEERRYILSLCYLLCAAPSDLQAEFLDDYTADGLLSKMLQDIDTLNRVKKYLRGFRINTELNESVLRGYIKQFYIHSATDARRKPIQYLESVLRLILSSEERTNVFNYMWGFELLKMMFKMSWLQMERLALLQKQQESFINTYIKPIQTAHRLNGIVSPKDEKIFFARRAYFVRVPDLTPKKVVELVMATFTTEIVNEFGFSLIRHRQSFRFDWDYIFNSNEEQEGIFAQDF